MRALIFFKYIIREFPNLLVASSLILILTGIIETVALFFIAPIVDLLISSELNESSVISQKIISFLSSIGLPSTIWVVFSVYILLNIIKSLFQICSNFFILKLKYALCKDITLGAYDDFFSGGWKFFRTNKQGHLLNTFLRETAIVGDGFAGMARFAASAFQLIIFVIVPFYVSWEVMSLSILSAILIAIPLLLIGKISHSLGEKNTSTSNDLSHFIQEYFSAAKSVIGFAKQKSSLKGLESVYDRHIDATLKSQTFTSAITISYSSLGLLGIMVTLLSAQWFSLPIAETSILVVALIKIVPIIGFITGEKNLMDNSFPSYEQIMRLRDEAKKVSFINGVKKFSELKDSIIIKDLSFHYNNDEKVLKNINIKISKGEMIALVGKSGSGKTTLVDILMGFNEPYSGEIVIDGISMNEYSQNSIRRKIGYVPQDSTLFNMSVFDNLTWAKNDATLKEIQRACKFAHADEFINNLPDKYFTLVGDRGVRLSGGQLQRLALAKAIIKKPDILILDEATSSLDSESEKKIQNAIENISKESTLIVIAHRLSTIINATNIYVLKKGMIDEYGNYGQLKSNKSTFYNMLEAQKFR